MKQVLALVFALALTAWAQSNERTAQSTTGDLPRPQGEQMDEKDSALAEAVRAKLGTRPELASIQVQAHDGVVTLEGAIASRAERARARDMARSVPGVKSVRDRMTTAAGSTAGAPGNTAGSIVGNTEAESGVKKGGAADAKAGSSNSTTPSLNPGTNPAPAPPKPPPPTTPPNRSAVDPLADDPTLVARIDSALRSDSSLAGESVSVRDTDDAIELSGTVKTGRSKVTAMRIALSFAGNRRISDKITVERASRNPNQPATAAQNTTQPTRDVVPSAANSAVPK